MHENAAPPRGRASRPGEKIGQLQLLVLTIATHLACVDIRMMEAGFLRIRGMRSSSRAWFAATAVQELREMPLIVFPGKELQASSPYCRMPQAIRAPGNSLRTPRKISEKDSQLENLLRSTFRLRNAQKRALRTKTESSKRNRKAR